MLEAGTVVDDARHAVLSRAEVAYQSRFSGAAWTIPRAPSPRRRPGQVLEVEARSALTDFPLDDGWSLNPYVGCLHACLYCYVPSVAKVERPRWGSYVIAKRNLPTLLAREVRHRRRARVFLSSATDPYQAVEGRLGLTRMCVEILARAEWPLRVLTRSPLVLRDVDLLRSFQDVTVGLSVPTFDEEARRVLEPQAPPIGARLRALRRLADAGLRTYANLMPLYPLTNGVTPESVAEALVEARVSEVHLGPWRYLDSMRDLLHERVHATLLEDMPPLLGSESYYRALIARLGRGLRERGLEVHD